MQTLVKYPCYLIGLLFSLFIAGSSNQLSSISFWHVLHAQANPLQSYWQFPRYFSNNIAHLPELTLGFLARKNIPSAQYNYSLKLINASKNEQAKLFWLQSIEHVGHNKRQQLAHALLKQGRWNDLQLLLAQNLLPKGAAFNHLALHKGSNYEQVSPSFLHQLGFAALNTRPPINNSCSYNVLLLGVNREALFKLSSFAAQYNKKPEPQSGAYCLSKPVYAGGAIDCAPTSDMANCLWQNAHLKAQSTNGYDYTVIMGTSGSANVTGKKMQLSTQANYNVFLHELMHFSGFEDEYTLPISKQRWLCKRQGYVAPNLYISQGEAAPNGWHKSLSCQQGGVAYKPAKQWSIMQYQQLGLSKRYRALWVDQINAAKTAQLD